MTTVSSIELLPVSRAQGRVILPGSKSISNRALLLAALAEGETTLTGVLESDDTRYMLEALIQMGVKVEQEGDFIRVQGGAPFSHRKADLFLGNAGTAVRTLTATLAFMGGDFVLRGIDRMHHRPIGDLVDAVRSAGASVTYLGAEGYPPLAIGEAQLDANSTIRIKGEVSSQFLTALLMAAPLWTAVHNLPLRIEVEGVLISQPYIAITLDMMRSFGVEVVNTNWESFEVPSDARYASPGKYHVEGDASSASYFLALGAIGQGPIRIEGVGSASVQGDAKFAELVQAMGATVQSDAYSMTVSGINVSKGEKLKAFDMDFNLIPDAAMTAAALAMFAEGPCTLRNIASWRVKETDRIHAMHTELAKLGARVESGPDWLRVWPINEADWNKVSIETYDDHRIAMCFSLAAFGPKGVEILDPNCVAKTFPTYFTVFNELVKS